jgi:hypothetical protein
MGSHAAVHRRYRRTKLAPMPFSGPIALGLGGIQLGIRPGFGD